MTRATAPTAGEGPVSTNIANLTNLTQVDEEVVKAMERPMLAAPIARAYTAPPTL